MKTDRFTSISIRAAAVLLVGLVFAAGLPAAGQITLRVPGVSFTFESKTKKMAKALAQQVGEVQKRFDANRRALRTVQGANGEPAYSLQEVTGLITGTEKELDQAIERAGKSDLGPLNAWSAEKLRRIREKLPAPQDHTAALPFGLSTPRAVALVASLESLPLPGLASVSSAAPQQETVPAGTANRLLDQVGEVISHIFFLAANDDLEVTLWVGTTPAQKATFRFWSEGKVKGSTPAPTIIRTNGKREHVLRGVYDYAAGLAQGAVTELVKYPNPAGDPAAQLASERLDLVDGSSFFCCRFKEQYCHHVANEKECRP